MQVPHAAREAATPVDLASQSTLPAADMLLLAAEARVLDHTFEQGAGV